MQLNKYFLKFIFLLPAVLFLTCSKKAEDNQKAEIPQEITINIEKYPTTLDGRKTSLLQDFNLIRAFNEGLYRLNKEGVLSEAIAESCTLLPDKTTYIIKLKETKWADGTPLTAHHFIGAWKSALAKDFSAPSASLLYPLKNAQAIKEGRVPTSMLGVHAQGVLGIVIELEEETPHFKELLSHPIYFPITDAFSDESSEKNHLCNGPFYITSMKEGSEIIAARNKRYWDKDSVKLNKLNMIAVDKATAFNMFQNNELHLGAVESLQDDEVLEKDPMLQPHLQDDKLKDVVQSQTGILDLKWAYLSE